MVKHGNNPRGKSDKHQAHNKKYASTHLADALERWYKKVTTPKATKIKIKKTLSICNVPVDFDQAKEIKECINAWKKEERKYRLLKFKRSTHWIARNQQEVEHMFPNEHIIE